MKPILKCVTLHIIFILSSFGCKTRIVDSTMKEINENYTAYEECENNKILEILFEKIYGEIELSIKQSKTENPTANYEQIMDEAFWKIGIPASPCIQTADQNPVVINRMDPLAAYILHSATSLHNAAEMFQKAHNESPKNFRRHKCYKESAEALYKINNLLEECKRESQQKDYKNYSGSCNFFAKVLKKRYIIQESDHEIRYSHLETETCCKNNESTENCITLKRAIAKVDYDKYESCTTSIIGRTEYPLSFNHNIPYAGFFDDISACTDLILADEPTHIYYTVSIPKKVLPKFSIESILYSISIIANFLYIENKYS